MQKIVDHLRKLPFIDDIIIWNNNPQAELSVRGHDIQIVQSPRNMVTYGRFLATRYARNPIIYTQDDDCLVLDIQKLYSLFCRDSSRICHGLKGGEYDNRGKYIYNTAHMAFVGWGGFFLKEWVSVFNMYVERYGFDHILCSKADRIFSILLNTVHNTEKVRIENIGGESGVEALWVAPDFQKKALIAEERSLQLLGITKKKNSRSLQDTKPKNKFVVLTSCRTGSNYLCAQLNAHPDIHCHNEIFHKKSVKSKFPLQPKEKMQSTLWRDANATEFVRSLWEQTQGRQCVGFKMFHVHNMDVILQLLSDSSVAKILLKRKNMVRQYVSLVIGYKIQQWFLPPSKERMYATVHIDPQLMIAHIEEVNRFFAQIYITLTTRAQEYMEVFYEDITGPQQEEHFAKIYQLLGLEPLHVKVDLRKQNPEPLSELIENYTEVCNALRGNEIEKFLYEEELCNA